MKLTPEVNRKKIFILSLVVSEVFIGTASQKTTSGTSTTAAATGTKNTAATGTTIAATGTKPTAVSGTPTATTGIDSAVTVTKTAASGTSTVDGHSTATSPLNFTITYNFPSWAKPSTQKGGRGPPNLAFSNHTKILAVGGDNGTYLSRVEAINLEDSRIICDQISSIPKGNYKMTLGVTKDLVKMCGGGSHPNKCFDYKPAKDRWDRSRPMLHGRYRHAASFIYDYWLLSGGAGGPYGITNTTERWTGTEFEECPPLPRGMKDHCQLTVDETHVFFAAADRKPNYLIDIVDDVWTIAVLDKMTYAIDRPSCGLIKTKGKGLEAVIAGQRLIEIFNFDRRKWRKGLSHATPYFYGAAHLQLSDTFIVVGGLNLSLHHLDTIYKFDNQDYTWDLLEQRLEVPVSGLGVVTVPDDFLTCKVRYPDLAFNDYTKLVVIGGYDGRYLSTVESFDLEDTSTGTCNSIQVYPQGQYGMAVGVIQGVIKSCGGYRPPKNACFDYHPDSNTWNRSADMSMNRLFHGHSFIDNLWLLSGGEDTNSTEYWNGTAFQPGPFLPRKMRAHCQLTVNHTHIFFATGDQKMNYLLDWFNQMWNSLPPLTKSYNYLSCGMINNPNYGREAVVVGQGNSEIFNFNSLTWRDGPSVEHFSRAAYTQLSDTFLVVGGNKIVTSQYWETIYKFDNINYKWATLCRQLQTVAGYYRGVVTVPDTFVNCTQS